MRHLLEFVRRFVRFFFGGRRKLEECHVSLHPYWDGVWPKVTKAIRDSLVLIAPDVPAYDNRVEVVMSEPDYVYWMQRHKNEVERAGSAQLARLLQQPGFPDDARITIHWICGDPERFKNLESGQVEIHTDHVPEDRLCERSVHGQEQQTTVIGGPCPGASTDTGSALPVQIGPPLVELRWEDVRGTQTQTLPVGGTFGRDGMGCAADARMQPRARSIDPSAWRVSRAALSFGRDSARRPTVRNLHVNTVYLYESAGILALGDGDSALLNHTSLIQWSPPETTDGFQLVARVMGVATLRVGTRPAQAVRSPQTTVTTSAGRLRMDFTVDDDRVGIVNVDIDDMEIGNSRIDPGETLVIPRRGTVVGRVGQETIQLKFGVAA